MTVTHKTAHALKAAGFPQPGFIFGQKWVTEIEVFAVIVAEGYYGEEGATYGFDTSRFVFSMEAEKLLPYWAFAPTLDDITPHLPKSFALEMWDGKPSCTSRDDERPMRVSGDTFAEAAAGLWLMLKMHPAY